MITQEKTNNTNLYKGLFTYNLTMKEREKNGRFKKGHKVPWNVGFKKGNKINKGKTKSRNHKKKISESLKGRRVSPKTEFKKGDTGKKSGGWRGGLTPIHLIIRNSKEYRLWRKAVLERDNYECIWCGSKEKLHADHIKDFAHFPELRFAIDNGRALCRSCHLRTSNYGGKNK